MRQIINYMNLPSSVSNTTRSPFANIRCFLIVVLWRQMASLMLMAVVPPVRRQNIHSINAKFLPQVIQGVGYCCALHRLSVCPSVRSSRPVTTLQPTIFNGSCSYLVQPLTLVGVWILLVMRLLCSFLGSSDTLKIYEFTDWLASWTRPAEGSHPMDGIFVN